jgi:hypothetical protein
MKGLGDFEEFSTSMCLLILVHYNIIYNNFYMSYQNQLSVMGC